MEIIIIPLYIFYQASFKLLPTAICIASFPGSPEREYVYAWKAWYLFSREYGVIKIGQVFKTERQRFARYLTNFAFNTWYV